MLPTTHTPTQMFMDLVCLSVKIQDGTVQVTAVSLAYPTVSGTWKELSTFLFNRWSCIPGDGDEDEDRAGDGDSDGTGALHAPVRDPAPALLHLAPTAEIQASCEG